MKYTHSYLQLVFWLECWFLIAELRFVALSSAGVSESLTMAMLHGQTRYRIKTCQSIEYWYEVAKARSRRI